MSMVQTSIVQISIVQLYETRHGSGRTGMLRQPQSEKGEKLQSPKATKQ